MKQTPNLWSIMSKVRLEAFLWGAGTALGELPPYFMAKAARLSGYDPDDAEEMAEFEALKAKRGDKNLSLMDKGKLFMERVVERIGFLGILACASVSIFLIICRIAVILYDLKKLYIYLYLSVYSFGKGNL